MSQALASQPALSGPAPVVAARDLGKDYGSLQAVKGVSFDIHQGEIFGFIGPDGAGKTSIFHVLGGVMDLSSGNVSVLGTTPRLARPDIGYLTQQFSLYLDLSVEENIRYAGGLRRVPEPEVLERKDRYLRLMNLQQFGSRLAGQLSGGMKQKLALCCALIARPKLLLLDEPTTGVDPVSRREFWDVLMSIAEEGVTVAVATPYLDEAERCHRVALMHQGLIQELGTPKKLREGLGMRRLEVRATNIEALEMVLARLPQVEGSHINDVQQVGDRLDVLVDDIMAGRSALLESARGTSCGELLVEEQAPTLESVFVSRLKAVAGQEKEHPFPYSNHLGQPSGLAIGASDLSKLFGDFQAVKRVSLTVNYGEIFGLLGANGAGKTTTIKMLCGLLQASAGEMILAGQKSDLRHPVLREQIGYMSQKFTLYDDLTVLENLEFYCGVYDVPAKLRKERIDWVMLTCGLSGQEKLLTGQLPGGWKQRLSFAASVMHQPKILFLDEPTSGVDPLARRQLWRLIRYFARNGTAVLVTTHFLEEAEHCQKLAFMAAGEIVAQGSPREIKSGQPGQLIELQTTDMQRASAVLKAHFDPWRVSIFADKIHLVLADPDTELGKIDTVMSANHIGMLSMRSVPFSLEDAFIGIIERAK